jgi:N-acetylgalactosamine PTS system EIIA component
MSEPVRGLVVAHATLAAGLVASVRQIAGADADALVPLSNDGLGPEALQARVREALGDGPGVVFTDMPSGSCAMAARRLSHDRPDTAIVCGANLPMLLDFIFHRELPLAELVERLVEKGQTAIHGTHRDATNADRAVSS